MGVVHIAQRPESEGSGTVKIGNSVEEEIGGSMRFNFSDDDDDGRCFSSGFCFGKVLLMDDGRLGSIGGGSSMLSAALRDSWRAKSEAYHHSRNLSAKMLVGSRIFRELSKRGLTVRATFLGEKMEPPSPGLAGPTLAGCVASSIAL
jgi:hypothetical protein